MARIDATKLDLKEKVVQINRVAKVVKGGRRFSFSVLVVIGDGHGHVGIGTGKASEVPDGIRKAVDDAKKNLIVVPMKGSTLFHEVVGVFKASRVMLRPAAPGTGIHYVLTKSIRSDNTFNVVQATLQGLRSVRSPEVVAALRGKTTESLMGG